MEKRNRKRESTETWNSNEKEKGFLLANKDAYVKKRNTAWKRAFEGKGEIRGLKCFCEYTVTEKRSVM
jgi:hypothetical protein